MDDFNSIDMLYKHKSIELQLGNYCNYDCIFCNSDFKSGTKRPLSLDSYKKMVNNLIESTDDVILFSIQGGEPTLWPELPDLLSYIKDKKGLIQVFSNGSRTIRWWTEFLPKKLIDRLIISHHAEQNADPEHTVKVMLLAKEYVKDLFINVTILSSSELFDKTIAHAEYIKSQLNDIAVNMSPIMFNNQNSLSNYSQNQLDTIKRLNDSNKYSEFTKLLFGLKVVDDKKTFYSSSQSIILNNKNKFKGWSCDAGKSRIVIETDEAYSGICKVNGPIGKVSEETVNWLSDSVLCNLEYCNCGADLSMPKRKIK